MGIAEPRRNKIQLGDSPVRVRSWLTAASIIAAACSSEKKPPRPGGSASQTLSPGAVRDTSAADAALAADSAARWTVTVSGIGPIRVGMTLEDLRRIAGNFPSPKPTAECTYVHPASTPGGVSIMLARGKVARIDVDSAGVRTDAGVGVGDSTSRVNAAYPGRVDAAPHKYVPDGQYLTARPSSPADSALRIVFEVEKGRVTRFRSGRRPEVEWVERCG
jgi:hypothetical protein